MWNLVRSNSEQREVTSHQAAQSQPPDDAIVALRGPIKIPLYWSNSGMVHI